MKADKDTLLNNLKLKIFDIQKKILEEKFLIEKLGNKPISEIKSLKAEDRVVEFNFKDYTKNRTEELSHLYGSPFFVKCEVFYAKNNELKTFYFAKHPFMEESVYSWVAPIASIRFEQPGTISYRLPNGEVENAILKKKEQYMIVDGKVIFFALEGLDRPRDLIYQEHFSTNKDTFMLPEIVSLMEKAQDAVVRAHHQGPFAISGPAGSGKTTLALHRVAYLVQAPDSAHLYPAESIIVFVQDAGAKDYFSHILPELGIHNVKITTFFEWASEVLNLEDDVRCVSSYKPTNQIDYKYEYSKLKILHGEPFGESSKDVFNLLTRIYKKHLPEKDFSIFYEQKKKKVLDRIDLTMALSCLLAKKGKLEITSTYQVIKDGKIVDKIRKSYPEYSLMVIDEFQNYIPEQIRLFKSCLSKRTNAILFVGDLAQRVQLGTLNSWNDIQENIPESRKVKLYKVYRNTRQILEYINNVGYQVEVPTNIKEGREVSEIILSNPVDFLQKTKELVNSLKEDSTIGIICGDEKYINEFKQFFSNQKNIRVSTMFESQGVEFNTVILIGASFRLNTFYLEQNIPDDLKLKVNKINRDLIYIALTRALNQMYIIDTSSLKKAVSFE